MQASAQDPSITASPPWAHLRIPPFPQVAMRVMQLAGSADVSMRALSDLISTDSAFSSEVLTIANSALYASRVPIHSILQAVAILGTTTLRGVCLTVGVRAYMGKSLHHASLRAIWRHSLACGLIARQLAGAGATSKDTAYTAGVLHDIGRMALAVLQPKEYAALLGTHRGPAVSMLACEHALFGFDHCQAGAQLIANWNLPNEFDAVVAQHHADIDNDCSWRLPDLIRLSCRIADTVGFAVFPGCEIVAWADLLAACEEPARSHLPVDFAGFCFDISRSINALELTR
jgi:putative nucleotidyltransferase with HDIG domain